jgi:hypothetical protein
MNAAREGGRSSQWKRWWRRGIQRRVGLGRLLLPCQRGSWQGRWGRCRAGGGGQAAKGLRRRCAQCRRRRRGGRRCRSGRRRREGRGELSLTHSLHLPLAATIAVLCLTFRNHNLWKQRHTVQHPGVTRVICALYFFFIISSQRTSMDSCACKHFKALIKLT